MINEDLLTSAELNHIKDLVESVTGEEGYFGVLKQSGFTLQAIPEDLGGIGFDFYQVHCQLTQLTKSNGQAALALASHLYWTGIASELWYSKDYSLQWLLREASEGEYFAVSGGFESVALSLELPGLTVEPVDCGYCFSGEVDLTTVPRGWTRLGLSGRQLTGSENQQLVSGFLPREAVQSAMLGRSTLSSVDGKLTSLILDAIYVPDRYILCSMDHNQKTCEAIQQASLVWKNIVKLDNILKAEKSNANIYYRTKIC
ncbi:MAG: hypothetical protein ACI8P9_005652 [Parasphingorhabdus sp.]|jgi:hypothetical protein